MIVYLHSCLGFRVQGLRFRASGFRDRDWGSGFRGPLKFQNLAPII